MKLGSMTEEQFSEWCKLIEDGKCDELKDILFNIELKPFQTLLTRWITIVKTFICTLDTGLGKTVIASAVMVWLRENKGYKKFLYVAENAGLSQTAIKIRGYTGFNIRVCNATTESASSLIVSDGNFDVLLISYQALQSYGIAAYLVANIDDFNIAIFDECQWLSELNNSNTWEITKQMRKYFEYFVMFSSTPFKTNPMQLLKQVELLDYKILGNINKYIKDKCSRDLVYGITDWFGLEKIKKDLTVFVNGFTREELDIEICYEPHAIITLPTINQIEVEPKTMYRIKSDTNAESFEKVVSIIEDNIIEFRQGIIYCSTNNNKALLRDELLNHGISVEVIDGTLSNKKERRLIQQRYLDGEISVLIVNITTTLDLPSSYCIFYELCDAGTMIQFIGRCVRGLEDSNLTVYYMIVDGTYEVEYFYNCVYKKSKYLQGILGKDEKLMSAIKKQIDLEL